MEETILTAFDIWFKSEIKEGRIFTSMPDEYYFDIDDDGDLMYYGTWSDNGDEDYGGVGNAHKWYLTIWENKE